MSRTYNHSRYSFDKYNPDIEYPNGYKSTIYNTELAPGAITGSDYSRTTTYDNPYLKATRHPNKKRRTNSLGREFTQTGMLGTRYWRNRFGEASNKSSRDRLTKREMNHTRRHRLKNNTQQLINESLDENI